MKKTLALIILLSSSGYKEFEATKVGSEFQVTQTCGCNTCTLYYLKVDETHAMSTGGTTTLLNCTTVEPVELKPPDEELPY